MSYHILEKYKRDDGWEFAVLDDLTWTVTLRYVKNVENLK